MMPAGGMGGGPGMPGQTPDFNKLILAEKGIINYNNIWLDSIELVKHKSKIENADDIYLAKLRK